MGSQGDERAHKGRAMSYSQGSKRYNCASIGLILSGTLYVTQPFWVCHTTILGMSLCAVRPVCCYKLSMYMLWKANKMV